jgi:hypothetical protein
VGGRAEAVAQIEQAACIYRRLAGTAPDAYLPDLALSLNNLSSSLAEWVGGRRRSLRSSKRPASTGDWSRPPRTPTCPIKRDPYATSHYVKLCRLGVSGRVRAPQDQILELVDVGPPRIGATDPSHRCKGHATFDRCAG